MVQSKVENSSDNLFYRNSFEAQKTLSDPMTIKPKLSAPKSINHMNLDPKLPMLRSEATTLTTTTRSQVLNDPRRIGMAGELRFAALEADLPVARQSFIAFHGIDTEELYSGIGQSHLIAWREHLTQSGASPRTIQNRLAAVSSLFKHLCERQVATRNPAIGVKRPRVNNNRVDATVLTPEQVRSLFSTPKRTKLKGIRDRAILHVLFYTGCRVNERNDAQGEGFF